MVDLVAVDALVVADALVMPAVRIALVALVDGAGLVAAAVDAIAGFGGNVVAAEPVAAESEATAEPATAAEPAAEAGTVEPVTEPAAESVTGRVL